MAAALNHLNLVTGVGGPDAQPTREKMIYMRQDAKWKREQILQAARLLVEQQGTRFSLPDLAREAGVGIATVYRHFADVDTVLAEITQILLGGLTDRLAAEGQNFEGRELFEQTCRRWVESALAWSDWAAGFRSGEGFLVRSQRPETNEHRQYTVLAGVLDSLISAGEIPAQDVGYAVVVWVALFDERVMRDLTFQGYEPTAIADRLVSDLWSILLQGREIHEVGSGNHGPAITSK